MFEESNSMIVRVKRMLKHETNSQGQELHLKPKPVTYKPLILVYADDAMQQEVMMDV